MPNVTNPIPITLLKGTTEGKGAQKTVSTKTTRTKKSRLIALLKMPKGARTPTICRSMGWQNHTVRAALSGLRKEGHVIATSKSPRDGVTVYRIEFSPVVAV